MRILFVHAAAEMSIGDVSRGYRAALERQGHDIKDYHMTRRMAYHRKSVPENIAPGTKAEIIARMASETILTEAMCHDAELVVIMSGLNVHPIALWLLGRLDIPVATVFTESPYDDPAQTQWASLEQVNAKVDLTVFTNDEYSARIHGWHFLPPSFDQNLHHPDEENPETKCDVLMIGSGWQERTKFLEAVNWEGIHLKLYGVWPDIRNNPNSPLFEHHIPLLVNNAKIAGMYASAKICLNFHRVHDRALTPGPRVYEIAACGAFQLSDPRPSMVEIFGDSIPTFKTPTELEEKIRYYLERPEERAAMAAESRRRVANETFDTRAAELIRVMAPNVAGRKLKQVATT